MFWIKIISPSLHVRVMIRAFYGQDIWTKIRFLIFSVEGLCEIKVFAIVEEQAVQFFYRAIRAWVPFRYLNEFHEFLNLLFTRAKPF